MYFPASSGRTGQQFQFQPFSGTQESGHAMHFLGTTSSRKVFGNNRDGDDQSY